MRLFDGVVAAIDLEVATITIGTTITRYSYTGVVIRPCVG